MNKRNVDALAAVLAMVEWKDLIEIKSETDLDPGASAFIVDVPRLAHRLADAGALVPSAITLPQQSYLGNAAGSQIVPMLLKIAKGEQ